MRSRSRNVRVPSFFADRQGRSLVIAFDVGQPEPDRSDCLGAGRPPRPLRTPPPRHNRRPPPPSRARTTTTSVPTSAPSRKVFVCKFVGTPGVDERLQSGQNPISVSVNAIPLANIQIGSFFADAQGRSLVITFDVGQPEPDISECRFGGTTTSSTTSTTSTTAPPSTTSTTSTTRPPQRSFDHSRPRHRRRPPRRRRPRHRRRRPPCSASHRSVRRALPTSPSSTSHSAPAPTSTVRPAPWNSSTSTAT